MIETASYSDQGGREYNEDSCMIMQYENNLCAVVADGLGGHGGGRIASLTAINAVKECFETSGSKTGVKAEDVRIWFGTANDRVLEMQTNDCQMKTTMALICMESDADKVLAAHLGDTRIYHFADGKLSYISFDHSVSRMAVLAGEIRMEEIRFHIDRNKLLKAVGKGDEALPEMKEFVMDRSVQNAFLLCTDGFWEYVTEEQMEETLSHAATPEEWLESMRWYIRDKAKENNDNNSAVAVFVK